LYKVTLIASGMDGLMKVCLMLSFMTVVEELID